MTASPAAPRRRNRPPDPSAAPVTVMDAVRARKAIKRAHKAEAKLLRWIKAAHDAGDAERFEQLGDLYSRSFHCRLAVADDINREAKVRDRFSQAEVFQIAARADPSGIHGMGARLHLVSKGGGTKRLVMSTNPETKVIQRMVARRIEPWVMSQLRPDQYAKKGGTKAAYLKIQEQMREGDWVAVLDVRNFYPSIDAEVLAAMMPVPLQLARAAICASALDLQPSCKNGGRARKNAAASQEPSHQKRGHYLMNPKTAVAHPPPRTDRGEGTVGGVPRNGGRSAEKGGQPSEETWPPGAFPAEAEAVPSPREAHHPHSGVSYRVAQFRPQLELEAENCRRGLIKGSATSNLIAELVMAWVLNGLPANARVVNNTDNTVIFGRTKHEVVEAVQTLTRALARSPAGQLTFGEVTIARVQDGFDYMSYGFRVVRGEAMVMLSDKSQRRFFNRFDRLMSAKDYAGARLYAERWAAQFKMYPAIDLWLEWALSEVDYAAGQDREVADK